MSTPDPNSTASVAVSRSLAETPVTPANTVRTPPSQPPPAPPPPPPHRAIAPLHHQPPHPFQQGHHLYAKSFSIRRPNPVTSSPHQHHQDPSALVYPFAPSGRAFPSQAGRPSPPSVVDPAVTVGNSGGYAPRSVFAYHQRQFGSTPHLDPMIQFMRAAQPQMHQFPLLGPGPPFGSGPMRGIPHFLQPRVAPPPSAIVDNGGHKNARSREEALVLVRDRKVRITDGASLYSLCRSWLRNGVQEGIQPQSSDTMKPLPKPLPVHMIETSLSNDQAEELTNEDKEDEESTKELSEKELLKRHVNRAKKIRAKLKQERLWRIARYKARLALLLPSNGEQSRSD